MSSDTSTSVNKGNEKKKIWFVSLENEILEMDEVYGMESVVIGDFYKYGEFGPVNINIKTSILSKALDFCKERALIQINHAHGDDDQNLFDLQMLKDFDSNFLQRNRTHALDLIDAACKLEIKSLLFLMMKDVVDIISQKTPEEIHKFFDVHLDDDDEEDDEYDDKFGHMEMVISCPGWVFK